MINVHSQAMSRQRPTPSFPLPLQQDEQATQMHSVQLQYNHHHWLGGEP
jgi:hypothetical protein